VSRTNAPHSQNEQEKPISEEMMAAVVFRQVIERQIDVVRAFKSNPLFGMPEYLHRRKTDSQALEFRMLLDI